MIEKYEICLSQYMQVPASFPESGQVQGQAATNPLNYENFSL